MCAKFLNYLVLLKCSCPGPAIMFLLERGREPELGLLWVAVEGIVEVLSASVEVLSARKSSPYRSPGFRSYLTSCRTYTLRTWSRNGRIVQQLYEYCSHLPVSRMTRPNTAMTEPLFYFFGAASNTMSEGEQGGTVQRKPYRKPSTSPALYALPHFLNTSNPIHDCCTRCICVHGRTTSSKYWKDARNRRISQRRATILMGSAGGQKSKQLQKCPDKTSISTCAYCYSERTTGIAGCCRNLKLTSHPRILTRHFHNWVYVLYAQR